MAWAILAARSLEAVLGIAHRPHAAVSVAALHKTMEGALIRGLYGDRIRILQNSGATLDLSGPSDDHRVADASILLERIEVLRGPGVFLYRGNAMGGVVNMSDNRIPMLQPGFTAALRPAATALHTVRSQRTKC